MTRNPADVALSLWVRELPRARVCLNPEVAIVPHKAIAPSEGRVVRVVERSST